MRSLELAACATICATLVISGCASGTATITGTLAVGNGACVYVRGPDVNGADLYWLRQLPSGYVADEDGIAGPDGSRIRIGDSLTVSGALSWQPLDRRCDTEHALDARAIE